MDDEADLIGRWQRGDTDALATIVRRWQVPVGRFLARMLGPSASVPDLVQDVFLRAHRAIGHYRDRGHFSTWLYQIALNLARDAARRNHRVAAPLPQEIPASCASAETVWDRKETGEAVAAALAALPPHLREVLVLRHYEDLGFEEMSRVLGTPASTLKSRFAVALRQMRERLIEAGYGDDP